MNTGSMIGLAVGLLLTAASAAKWRLPVRKAAPLIAVSFATAVAVLMALGDPPRGGLIRFGTALALLAGLYVGGILVQFYRDPERTPPAEPDVIVSPADGKVIYIKSVAGDEIPVSTKKAHLALLDELAGTGLHGTPLWQVGIALMFTDVHVNRAPIGGAVKAVRHRPGRFLSLRKAEALDLNERQIVIIENKRIAVGLAQIASRLVRRIESYVREGQTVDLGARIGIIKFGSQVDLFLPQRRVGDLLVAKGAYLYAGQTLICRLRKEVAEGP